MSKKQQKRQARRRAQHRQQDGQRQQPGNPERAAELRRWKASKRRGQPRPEPEPLDQPFYLPELGLTRYLGPLPAADWGRLPPVIRARSKS